MKYLIAIRAYAAKFYAHAKSKVTTYVALATAGVTELVSSWDATAAILPHWIVENKAHIFAAASLIPIWTRIRRALSE